MPTPLLQALVKDAAALAPVPAETLGEIIGRLETQDDKWKKVLANEESRNVVIDALREAIDRTIQDQLDQITTLLGRLVSERVEPNPPWMKDVGLACVSRIALDSTLESSFALAWEGSDHLWGAFRNHRVAKWEARTGKLLFRSDDRATPQAPTVVCLAVSKVGGMVAVADDRGGVMLRNSISGEPMNTLPSLPEAARQLAWSPSGEFLAAISRYEVLMISHPLDDTGTWSVVYKRKPVHLFLSASLFDEVPEAPCCLAWLGEDLAIGLANGSVWIGDRSRPLSEASSVVALKPLRQDRLLAIGETGSVDELPLAGGAARRVLQADSGSSFETGAYIGHSSAMIALLRSDATLEIWSDGRCVGSRRVRTLDGGGYRMDLVSPDGKLLLLPATSEVWVMEIAR